MRKRLFKSLWLGAAVLAIAGCGGGDGAGVKQAEAGSAAPVDRTKIESFVYTGEGDPSAFKARGLDTKRGAALIDLGALSIAKSAGQTDAVRPGTARKIGLRRDVPQTSTASDTTGRIAWKSLPSGAQVGTIGFRSPAAVGVRIGMQVDSLPGDAIVRAYSPTAATAFETSGREVLATVDANRAAGADDAAARLYWLPVVDGTDAVLEIEVPAGIAADSVRIAVPQVSHLYASAKSIGTMGAKVGESDSCEVDVSCRSDYAEESKSVALMLYVEDGQSYACTGTLLADRTASGTPYFLSANHCIDRQVTASSLETYWFYRSSACNSNSVNSGARRLTGGAALLYATTATDTAFLRLNSAPPAGAVFAGSATTAVAVGTNLTGLHHPRADLQKISEGALVGNANCTPDGSGFRCTNGNTGSNYMALQWRSGVTETGSSGSSVFATSGGKKYVVGQLYGGSASCAAPSSPDVYGRFDIAYNAALNKFLDPATGGGSTGRTAVYRFYNASTQAHFFTLNVTERNYVIDNYKQFQYEGAAFYAYPSNRAGLNPVFRFYNTATGAHFYTINADERNFVAANYRQFTDEGPTWYARTTPDATTQPIYRFYNPQSGNHFYTISLAERDYIRANNTVFKYEGEVYYGWTSQ